ncbi:MAG: S26 family signal peptidase [Deferribacteraceae bacterium]|jgi:type IV secretory pathway protease TraF|nr:S26 family signal peptidase [Deferribacteraceae bacterium]
MKKRVVTVVIIILLSISIVYTCRHVGINKSDSLYFKVYWHEPITEIKKGYYYLIEYHGNGYSGLINKKAVCMPGENVERIYDMFFCEDVPIGKIQFTHDESGNEYPQYDGGKLTGSVFVIGDALNSYDSRYFGPLPVTSFRREVTPLW